MARLSEVFSELGKVQDDEKLCFSNPGWNVKISKMSAKSGFLRRTWTAIKRSLYRAFTSTHCSMASTKKLLAAQNARCEETLKSTSGIIDALDASKDPSSLTDLKDIKTTLKQLQKSMTDADEGLVRLSKTYRREGKEQLGNGISQYRGFGGHSMAVRVLFMDTLTKVNGAIQRKQEALTQARAERRGEKQLLTQLATARRDLRREKAKARKERRAALKQLRTLAGVAGDWQKKCQALKAQNAKGGLLSERNLESTAQAVLERSSSRTQLTRLNGRVSTQSKEQKKLEAELAAAAEREAGLRSQLEAASKRDSGDQSELDASKKREEELMAEVEALRAQLLQQASTTSTPAPAAAPTPPPPPKAPTPPPVPTVSTVAKPSPMKAASRASLFAAIHSLSQSEIQTPGNEEAQKPAVVLHKVDLDKLDAEKKERKEAEDNSLVGVLGRALSTRRCDLKESDDDQSSDDDDWSDDDIE